MFREIIRLLGRIEDHLGQAVQLLHSIHHDVQHAEATMSVELDQLIAQVQNNTNAEASALEVINGIAKRIADAIANASMSAADKASMNKLVSDLRATATPLSEAIVANTPAA